MKKSIMIENLNVTEEQEKIIKKAIRGYKFKSGDELEIITTGSSDEKGEIIYKIMCGNIFFCYI